MKNRKTIIVTSLISLSWGISKAGAQAPLAACGDISQGDTYVLSSNIQSAGTCLTIHDTTAVQLNCQSNAIIAGNAGSPGIVTNNLGSLTLNSCVATQQGSGASGFTLSKAPGTQLYFMSGGQFKGTVLVGGRQVAQIDTSSNPQILLTKSVSASTAKSGDTVTYTIAYQNSGTAGATNFVIHDVVPAEVAVVAGTISNSGTLSAGTIIWTIGAIAAGGSGSVSFQAKVK